MSSEIPLPLILVLALLLGVVLVVFVVAAARRDRSLLRWLRGFPRLAVRDVAGQGVVARVSGRVVAVGPPLLAPISGKPCVYYCVEIFHFEPNRRVPLAPGRTSVASEVQGRDFAIEDETGRALVRMPDPETVRAVPEPHRHYAADLVQGAAPELAAHLERWQKLAAESGFSSAIFYVETSVGPGDELLVVGEARTEPDPAPEPAQGGLRSTPERAVIVGSAAQPLLFADDRRYIYDRRPVPQVD